MADRFVTVPDSLELPAAVKVPIARLSDAGTAGRAVLDAETAADARTAIGAGTSSLAIGTGAGEAKAGNYQPTAANISDATAAGRGLLTAADAEAQRNGLDLGKRYVDPPVKPVLRTYPEALQPSYRVLFHTGSTYYACLQSAAGTLYKSTNNGVTWTALAGALGFEPSTLLRVAGTGTLIAIDANPTPTLKRSTDDGATWATIAGALNYAPLGDRGLTATPSGYILVGEYGNVANTVYRVRRSTDDGQTWATVLSAPGTDPATDPGHIHSITWDHIQNRFVAVMDRGVQEHYYSDDEGATWTKITGSGGSSTNDWPNFVAPMYFPDYIAWGYDNPHGTRIVRLSRANFYSGTWGNPEIVADIAPKASYDTFPLTADTWALCTATERIGEASATPASYATEIYVVYDGGSRVVGGLSHAVPAVQFSTMGGHRARFPNRPYAELDHAGQSWLNLPTTAIPYPYASVPYTVATAELMPTTTQAPHGPLITHQGVGIWNRGADGVLRNELVHAAGYMTLRNTLSTIGPELRLLDSSATGVANFYFSNVVHTAFVAASGANRIQLYDGVHIRMGTTDATAPQIHAGAGSPEGVKTAPPGSMFLRTDGGAGTSHYVKESGTGNTGWIAK